jgi:DNA polymerase
MKAQVLQPASPKARIVKKPARQTAAPLVPVDPSLSELKGAAKCCRACPLWKRATQTVFGAGRAEAKTILIGEQPGFDEDVAGEPFIGPAGKTLDKGLVAAGIRREEVYVTNVVKHFKWEPKGNQHLHKKPNASEIAACLPWLEAEIQAVKPTVIVCLGAIAAQALLGRDFRVSQQRGQLMPSDLVPYVLATVHPASILRAPDRESRHREMEQFIKDLKKVARLISAR